MVARLSDDDGRPRRKDAIVVAGFRLARLPSRDIGAVALRHAVGLDSMQGLSDLACDRVGKHLEAARMRDIDRRVRDTHELWAAKAQMN